MFIAISLILISGIGYANGIGDILKSARDNGRLDFGSLNPDPTIRHSWFTLLIGGLFTYLSLYGVNQTQIQRMLTVKTLKEAQRSLWWSWPILTILSGMTCFSGLIIYHYYLKCDPLTANRITKADQIMPIYVVDALGSVPGFCGLFVAGIYSASLSSVSSCLNSLSAVTYEDYVKPLYQLITGRQFKSNSSLYPKIIAGIYGLVCILLAFQASRFSGILQLAIGIFGAVGGPMLGIFTLGMVFI
jgi:solute carrier family 5 (sodium-coupled monocarboxylate transporter), member 8/12